MVYEMLFNKMNSKSISGTIISGMHLTIASEFDIRKDNNENWTKHLK